MQDSYITLEFWYSLISPAVRGHLEVVLPRPYSGEPVETVSAHQRIFPLPLPVET